MSETRVVRHEPTAQHDPTAQHTERRDRHRREAERLEAVGLRFSALNLGLFGAAASLGGAGVWGGEPMTALAGLACFAVFLVAYVAHGRLVRRRERETTRAEIHERHLARKAHRHRDISSYEYEQHIEYLYTAFRFDGAAIFAGSRSRLCLLVRHPYPRLHHP